MVHKPFDYSKWDNIEISDDEEDCHPNIDKASWFRMKHRSRVEREDIEEKEKEDLAVENATDAKKEKKLLKELDEGKDVSSELAGVRARMNERTERLEYMEKNRKWNVDNICHTAAEKTIVSPGTTAPSRIGPESEKDAVTSYAKFVEEHEAELEEFLGSTMDEARQRLHTNGDLLHEHAQSYILLSCLEDEMNGEHDKMLVSARNSQILSHVTELATSMNRHPRDVVLPFFKRISEAQYKKTFEDAVDGFVQRIMKRAVEKRMEMAEEVPKEERLGPGGLDPVEVFETLPKAMQEAFEAKDMQMLQVALQAMPVEEAKKHMKRCEESGLWVPSKEDDQDASP